MNASGSIAKSSRLWRAIQSTSRSHRFLLSKEEESPHQIHRKNNSCCFSLSDGPVASGCAGRCAAGYGHAGRSQRHNLSRRETTPATAPEIRRRDQGKRQGFHALVASACRAAQGCPQRAPHHDRRSGLWRAGHVRRRDPNTEPGSDSKSGATLHAVSLDRPLLADASSADHRTQSPFRRLRCYR